MAPSTPLSNLMTVFFNTQKPQDYAKVVAAFRVSEVGVRATGVPANQDAPAVLTSTDEQPFSVGSTDFAGGRKTLLAYADPKAFMARFGPKFNAGMQGEDLFKTVLLSPDCEGILINSAVVEMSLVIDRTYIENLVHPKPAPWWKFW